MTHENLTLDISQLNQHQSDIYYFAKDLQHSGFMFQYMQDDEFNGRYITVNGKKLLHFANCSYLGLEKNETIINASIQATQKHGSQTSCSRAALSSALYTQLENDLEKIFPGYHVVAPTTTLSHCAVMPAMITSDDAIILDAYVHNSVRMGSQLCKANGTFTILSKHNDMEHIKYLIYRLKKEGKRNIWYCADGIYSMHGDVLNTQGLKQLLDEEENFYAYIDDAHGLSCYGKNGKGYVLNEMDLHPKMIIVGSFAKSFAASGGIAIFPNKHWRDIIRLTGQTLIFSGPITPPTLGALVGSTNLHLRPELESWQKELNDLVLYFRNKAQKNNINLVTKDNTPIQLIQIGSTELTFETIKILIEKGIYATAVAYPAIEKGKEGVRFSFTRFIQKEDIDYLIQVLSDIKEIHNTLIHADNEKR